MDSGKTIELAGLMNLIEDWEQCPAEIHGCQVDTRPDCR
ncbi:hypothetical protein SAMN05216308_11132 [Nitrosospira sp. Nsp13]|nr:hypothetical protein SAMN05216308_11132 [Nitrosospira sp. Nsp13]